MSDLTEKVFNLKANAMVVRGVLWIWFFIITSIFLFRGDPDVHDAILQHLLSLSE